MLDGTAARVEEVTRQTGDDVLITEATRCLLTAGTVTSSERPMVHLKGKSEQVRLWAPLIHDTVGAGEPAVTTAVREKESAA